MKKLLSLTAVFLSVLITMPVSVSLTYDRREEAPYAPSTPSYTESAGITEEQPAEEPEETTAKEDRLPEPVKHPKNPSVIEYSTDVSESEEEYYAAATADPQTKPEPATEPGTEPETDIETEPEPELTEEPVTEQATEPQTVKEELINGSKTDYRGCDAQYIRVYNYQESRYMKMLLGDYIVCVVTAEMPSRFEIEALKAQAIACRSFTLYRSARSGYYYSSMHGDSGADVCTNSGHCQAYLTYEKALQRWHSKSYTDERIAKIKQAVIETSGIVAAYNGKPIEALYHATSYGYTENYNNNWGGDRPYLCAVETPETLETNHMVSTETFTSAEVKKILKKYGDPVFPEDKNEWFKLTPNDSGRVGKSDICGVLMNGQAMRGAFGLDSSKFTVSYNEETDEFVFDVRGWGHGVGLSQYGAGIYAEQGYDCEFIIRHYYTGVDLILWE